MTHRATPPGSLLYDLTPGSVMSVKPREALTLKVSEGTHGWWCAAYTGDGTKPGSLAAGAGSFATAEDAFAYLLDRTKDRHRDV